jgi:chemotaxis protein methyltransferase CheR
MALGIMLEPLRAETFNGFRGLIYEQTGISLRESKRIMLSNRLRRRIVALGLSGYSEYYDYLLSVKGRENELAHFIDAVTTNETYFFREKNHFKLLADTILPALLQRRRMLRIWSAGCSTGEEAYTLRIIFEEGRGRLWPREAQAGIIATDISRKVIAGAREGIYNERSLRFVPEQIRSRYFTANDNGFWRVSREIRQGVEFRVHNLLHEEPPEGPFDVIFCRNVLIYFDKDTQRKVVDGRFAAALAPRGHLFIGHSESLSGTCRCFRYVRGQGAPVYVKVAEGSP